MTMFQVVKLLMAASNGDKRALERSYLSGMDMNIGDYDRRTALHLACSEGHMSSIRFLVEVCSVDINIKDRWGCTPLEEARKSNNRVVAQYLVKQFTARFGPTELPIDEVETSSSGDDEQQDKVHDTLGCIARALEESLVMEDTPQII